jgi:hypothetical protein
MTNPKQSYNIAFYDEYLRFIIDQW